MDSARNAIGSDDDLEELALLRRSQAEWQRQRRLYEAILRNTPDLAYVFDLNHRFIYMNDGLLKMWGKTWDEAIGKTCLELGYEPWHAAMHEREIDQVIATKQPIRGEVPFTGTYGRRIYDYIFVPVLGANGEVEAVAGTTRDVTELRQAEEAQRAAAARDALWIQLADAFRTLEEPTAIQAAATRLLGDHLEASRVVYGDVSEEGVLVVESDYCRDDVPSVVGHHRFENFGSELLVALHAGGTLVVDDVEKQPELNQKERARHSTLKVRAYVAVPLIKNGRLVAVVGVQQAEPRAWRSEEIALIEETVERTWTMLERARAEIARRTGEERFRALVTATSDVVYRMSSDWSEMRHLVGRDFIADTLEPSQTWLDKYIHPDDQAHVMQAIKSAIQSKSIFELEHRVLRVDGTIGWVFSRAIPMLDRNGDVVEWFGAASDVTRRKVAEEALRESEAQFRQLAQKMPQIVWTNLPDGNVDFVNDRWLELTGQRLESVQAHPEAWMAAFHSEDRGRAGRTYWEGTRSGYGFTMEARLRCAGDGSYRWHLIRSVPVRGALGRLLKFVGTCTDIEDVKQAQGERERLVAELQAERRRLEQSQAELQEKIADLETFHDLAVDRELRMIELERELEAYKRKSSNEGRHLPTAKAPQLGDSSFSE